MTSLVTGVHGKHPIQRIATNGVVLDGTHFQHLVVPTGAAEGDTVRLSGEMYVTTDHRREFQRGIQLDKPVVATVATDDMRAVVQMRNVLDSKGAFSGEMDEPVFFSFEVTYEEFRRTLLR